jgi:hypothetical protein
VGSAGTAAVAAAALVLSASATASRPDHDAATPTALWYTLRVEYSGRFAWSRTWMRTHEGRTEAQTKVLYTGRTQWAAWTKRALLVRRTASGLTFTEDSRSSAAMSHEGHKFTDSVWMPSVRNPTTGDPPPCKLSESETLKPARRDASISVGGGERPGGVRVVVSLPLAKVDVRQGAYSCWGLDVFGADGAIPLFRHAQRTAHQTCCLVHPHFGNPYGHSVEIAFPRARFGRNVGKTIAIDPPIDPITERPRPNEVSVTEALLTATYKVTFERCPGTSRC